MRDYWYPYWGLNPEFLPWEGSVLPLHYTDKWCLRKVSSFVFVLFRHACNTKYTTKARVEKLAPHEGSDPSSSARQADILATKLIRHNKTLFHRNRPAYHIRWESNPYPAKMLYFGVAVRVFGRPCRIWTYDFFHVKEALYRWVKSLEKDVFNGNTVAVNVKFRFMKTSRGCRGVMELKHHELWREQKDSNSRQGFWRPAC